MRYGWIESNEGRRWDLVPCKMCNMKTLCDCPADVLPEFASDPAWDGPMLHPDNAGETLRGMIEKVQGVLAELQFEGMIEAQAKKKR